MCDTMYAGASVCAGGRSWFAKNSDRNPAEPQALCIVPRRDPSEVVRVGGEAMPFRDSGLAFALSKPSWMAGGEMGINERGVAIGNEAVFSRWKAARDGVLGMAILRAALASSASARDAVKAICGFTELEDQGGNGAYKGSLRYCNSYIVSDEREAYVVETAGRRWAWREIGDLAAISNAYSIESDYKRLDALTRKEIAPVNERAACSYESDPGRVGQKGSWRAYVEDRLRLRFTKGDARRAAVEGALRSASGAIGFGSVLRALRSHGGFDPAHPRWGHMTSVCMHAGGLLDNATTASMAVEYRPRPDGAAHAVIWFTGTSYPCLSIYKPILLDDGELRPLWTDYDYAEGSELSYARWERQRAWIGRARAGALGLDPGFAARRDAAQERLARVADDALGAAGNGAALEAARREANAAVREWDEYLEGAAASRD
jgi:hypothetical protein